MNSTIKARHRVARVGRLIVDGPFSIRPPQALDDYGWLECDLRVVHWAGSTIESAAIYVDDSANRDSGFLRPILRFAQWNRADDLRAAVEGTLGWPTAIVTLSYLDEARPEIDALIRQLQARFASLPFVAFGLSADRSVPSIPADDRGRVTLYSRNGIQSAEFTTPTSDQDGGLSEEIVAAIGMLRALRQPIDLEAGWRESYHIPLSAPELGGSHWWDYRPPTVGVASA